jgi:ABC-type transporter Mla maintaining outer membrane lipid asymmetry ATPase subunit MlaF
MEGDEASTKQPVVLSIVGFGGLGKTTLANLVYEKIKGQFACGAFVYVSHNPDTVRIFKDLLYQLDGVEYRYIHQGTWSEQQLISELRKFLQHKRYVCAHRFTHVYAIFMIQHVFTGSERIAALDKINLNFRSQATTLISLPSK